MMVRQDMATRQTSHKTLQAQGSLEQIGEDAGEWGDEED